MFERLSRALTSRAAGPAASGAAVLLAAALAISWTAEARSRTHLEAQVDALKAQVRASGLYWKTELSQCRAEAAAAPHPPGGRLTRVASDAMAERLTTEGPAGFDVCARMEAADQAVLASLKAK